MESGELQTLVPERIWQETYKALCEPRFDQYFQTLIDLRAFDQIFPEISDINSNVSENHILQVAIKKEISPKIKFCSIFLVMLEDNHQSLKDAITAMQERINIPKDYKNLVLLLESIYPMLFSSDSNEKKEFSAEQYLKIIEKLDALRNPVI